MNKAGKSDRTIPPTTEIGFYWYSVKLLLALN
jgi:hypothetical protein